MWIHLPVSSLKSCIPSSNEEVIIANEVAVVLEACEEQKSSGT